MPSRGAQLKERTQQYALLMRLDRPIGILLLLWPTLWALWIAAEGMPRIGVLLVFVLGVVLMRSAGCVINDYADRAIDPHVSRTRERPIASGRVEPNEALKLFAALCVAAFMLVLFMNSLTIMLSFVGVALAAIYPFTKRHTYLPQVFLGAAFGWAVPMAFAAQLGEVPQAAWLIFIATVLWATAYDTIYAMVDRDDDIKIGVKSTAILFGELDRVIIGVIQALLLLTLLVVGVQLKLGGFFYLGLLVATGLAVQQQRLIKNRDRDLCFKAFLDNNWFGMAIFVGLLLEYGI
ncbi:4-hydroxybenzoate polyprenyltransferase [Solemya pervernicosa gill symbiont]|uniref:4-hydroxybenzoate octaprenyltransferase n=1 Tax=Solemya pervernicosa gill symbiont TaxID=642797 RepID=A0A1T2LBR0_9GAMM|nr:4-hydroxybenzoate polyprenyltransferase [Solemya pervernicosa gill symbiont]